MAKIFAVEPNMLVDESNQDVDEVSGTETVWHEYECQSLDFGCKHPAEVVEPASLASCSLPPLTYPIRESLNKQIEEGLLSALQLEGIAYACQQHLSFLPNGHRRGFFIGDSAGVGKGRQIAGIILDNAKRGRNKSIWFSTSTDLAVDAVRDLESIGCTLPVHGGVQDIDKAFKGLGLSKEMQRGVLFSTYSSLVSATGSKSRFDQMVHWVGGEAFDGCLIFDECHKAKNFSDSSESGSKVAKAVVKLQQMLPKARVVYLSATGVTDISNMAFLERLGLWGDFASFRTFDSFKTNMGKRNLGALEMLSMELKLSGMHVSRGLSYREAEFDICTADLSDESIRMYHSASTFWMRLRHVFHEACNLTNSNKPWRAFWSVNQRFFKQLCICLKVPSVVEMAKQALNEGCCVVIGLQTTGEAQLDSWISEYSGQQGKDCVIGTSEVSPIFQLKWSLKQLIENYFPDYSTPTDGEIAILDGKNTEQIKERLAKLKQGILQELNKLVLPASALDDLIFRLGGPEKVAEMTGRKNRCVAASQKTSNISDAVDSIRVESRDLDNLEEKKLFMDGAKFVAIISDAASTGISLHAEKSVRNKRRRVHITIELPWAADQAVQQLGRSHRSSQVSAPKYKLLTSGIGGENRFVTAVASRLQSLGALTHGDRRASSGGMDLGEFNFNSAYGRQALSKIYLCAESNAIVKDVKWETVIENKENRHEELFWTGRIPSSENEFVGCISFCLRFLSTDFETFETLVRSGGIGKPSENERKDVKRFLNRLLGLPIHLQSIMFKYFSTVLDLMISNAKYAGTYDEGVSDIMANSITEYKKPRSLHKYVATGSSLDLSILRLDRGVSWNQAIQTFSETVKRIKNGIGLANNETSLENESPHDVEAEVEMFSDIPMSSEKEVAIDLTEPLEKDVGSNPELAEIDTFAKKYRIGGFYMMKKPFPNASPYILAIRATNSSQLFSIYRPNTGKQLLDRDENDLLRIYTRVDFQQAESSWKSIYQNTETQCIHGSQCKHPFGCSIGSRTSYVGIVSGCVVPFWNELQSILLDTELDLMPPARVLRIVRAITDDGSKFIGLRWPSEAFSALENKAKELFTGVREIILKKTKSLGFELSERLIFENVNTHARAKGFREGDTLIKVGIVPVDATYSNDLVMNSIRNSLLDMDEITLTVRVSGNSIFADKEDVTPISEKAAASATKQRESIKMFFTKKPENNIKSAQPVPIQPKRSTGRVVVGNTTKKRVLNDPQNFFNMNKKQVRKEKVIIELD